MANHSLTKSPLRYPGGKSKAIPQILEQFPPKFTDFREPFVGGGSVFLTVKQLYPQTKIWINDLNQDLVCFWQQAQTNNLTLVQEITKIQQQTKNGHELFDNYKKQLLADLSPLEKAIRFFVLNRITFSGTVDSGGYSEGAFQKRFTLSSIQRVRAIEPLLQNVKITNLSYQQLFFDYSQPETFYFFDPPYLSATQSRLYGKNGDLHLGFDHQLFAEEIKRVSAQWLITYDNHPQIRQNFAFAQIREWSLQYGMNNYQQEKANKGEELFISNYRPSNK